MRNALIVALFSLIPSTLLASPSNGSANDPRDTSDYHVLFDLEAHGKTDLVNGYGGYVQIYEKSDGNGGRDQWIRYCENFDGSGLGGRPNPARSRFKLLPFGSVDDTAYRCRDFTPADMVVGQPLIQMGSKIFFALKTPSWSVENGGEILFQFAKKIPLLGSPTYKTIRIAATRSPGGSLDYAVTASLPRIGDFPFHFFLFDVSGSGLGLPNGITGLTLDPTERSERKVDLDSLEGPITIKGTGKGTRHSLWPEGRSAR